MCGIVGFISNERQSDVVYSMLEVQLHRGPDDSGVFIEKLEDQFIHFGHNRLSILDLSFKAHQPFISDCGNYIIIFNGEIYNYKEIKKELEKLNYKFVSNSDTEVILYAYKEWGIDSINKFIGMFAFSILDKKIKKVILVRDRVGIKPLYFYTNQGEFLFSSEIKSFHQYPNFQKKLNKDVLPYYFQFGYIPSPHTIFQNCSKLEAGHYLEYDLQKNSYKIVKYWDINTQYQKEKFDKSEKEILEDLENLLDDAINYRLISDVPVGVFLSGGYDSSLVTAILSKNNTNLNTFTIGFHEQKYNEANHAKSIAKHFGTNHSEYYIKTNDILDLVDTLPFLYDEPFGDSSSIATILLSQLAKKDVTVALSADGGDESFFGYSKYFFLHRFSTVFSNNFKKTIFKAMVNSTSIKLIERVNGLLGKNIQQTNIRDKVNKLKRAISADSLDEMFLNASSSVDELDINKMLNFISTDIDVYKKFRGEKDIDFINHMMVTDYKTFLNDDILTKVDRATMSVSLEGREPLLDHRLIEYMARVPSKLKYKNNQGKYLSRQILYKYIPRHKVDKPKTGFQIPLNELLRSDLRYLIEKYLDSKTIDKEVFNLHEVERIRKDFVMGDDKHVSLIWFIIMYEMWREKWFS